MGYGPPLGHVTTRKLVRIDRDVCVGCGICVRYCPVGTVLEISPETGRAHLRRPRECGGCFTCLTRCPNGAIKAVVSERAGLIDRTPRAVRAPGQPRG